ncbi:MAG: D-glucuronyl C5-epimerase family protein [Micrococcales bacterium]|nr:D-glucuronyl C5-epimerase family protein [Micrococcales bacterium]
MRKGAAIAAASLVVLGLGLMTTGAGLLNVKLNRQYHDLVEEIDKALPAVGETDASLAKPDKTAMPYYDFGPEFTLDPGPYAPTGKYFNWLSMTPIAEDKDDDGVFLQYRKELDGFSHHPVAIAQYGLGQFSNYIETGDETFLEEARNQANYYVNNIDRATGMFSYDFDFPVMYHETLEAPWASAMAQGQAISLLSRLYAETGDSKYLETSELAMKPLSVPVSEGGLVVDFFGHPYYEEYPTELPSYTLNGFMYTIIGLYDFWQIADNETAKELYEAGIDTLTFCLPFYDTNGISLYWLSHLNGTGVSVHYLERYHIVHLRQLNLFSQIEDNEVVNHYLEKWLSYATGE